jgi:predicted ATPase
MGSDIARSIVASGQHMVDSFSIRNFRSFDDVKVADCRRLNILVGDNGSGKTALLEALFLAGGVSPEVVLRTRLWRGADNQNLSGTEEDVHAALWTDLFFKFNTNHAAVISLKGKAEHTRSVTVTVNPRGQQILVPPRRDRPGSPVQLVPNYVPIEFKWDIRGSGVETVKPIFQDGRLIVPSVSGRYVKAAFFAANQTAPSQETAARFSALSQKRRHDEFVSRFIDVFSNITDISIEVSAGITMLFAEVKGLDSKIPLTLASGGANKLGAILLGIASQIGGMVIVDEIENGFYYRRLPNLWALILEFARKYECQIFASTHSVECLRASAKLAATNPLEFSMMRTIQTDSGTVVRHFDGADFSEAILDDVELR